MAASNNVEFEAAKFLQKLIQESRDEPAKLATKLYVILQHMKSSGKEHSMPYQVISRAMETVISQHNLDIEALRSSRLPIGGSHAGESATSANAGSSQLDGPGANSKAVITRSEPSMGDPFDPSRQSIGPSSGHNYYQASMSQRPIFSHDPESPSAADPRSPGLQNQERRDQSNLGRTTNRKLEKRKRDESPLGMETHAEISQKVDSASSFVQPRIAKVNKVQQSGSSIGAVGSKQEDQTQSGVYMSENPAFAPKVHHERNMENYPSSSFFQVDHTVNNVPSQFIPPGGRSNVPEAMKNNVQDIGQSLLEPNMARGSSLGENEESIAASGKLFNELQLKQLRAQCLVFLSFRNGVPPKPLHVEIALGISHPKEGSSLDVNRPVVGGYQEATQSSNDPTTTSDPAIPSGRLSNVSGSYVCSTSIGQPTTQLMIKEVSLPSLMENGNYHSTELPLQEESRPLLSTKGLEVDTLSQMCDVSSNAEHPASSIFMAQVDNIEKDKRAFDHELHPPMAIEDGQIMPVNTSPVVEDEDGRSASLLHQPKHTMLEKWIMQVQKKKLQDEQNWLKKQKKAERRISSSFERLKENVSSSEDLAAKTKSVIELKKLQLLSLQQRLRGDFLREFFKPVVAEMDHLKSFKKHRHGRRIKQIERYEQKVKEERQKRIRERQKEFFGDIEVHKERLDDVFKIKRERLKGFNKFVKEFHKRKERMHREKIDRIQREKITLLKINDVEGYLRMVQDAKSDRVKQLLKETEKYLQKLGSKLREAKPMTNFEHDGDEIQTSASIENNESAIENEDECDQAKHYKESNEKYYMMAHSIKEEITEQPTTLQGGKLREYQMNGLRWLVSLYNNHLNGILADEMGLGKTVQVISLICYLMEAKNDRGPFLVVVPSSVLPGWESEINFWAPAVHKIVYAGHPEERRRLFKERIVHRKFNVLLTTYEYLMNKHDRPKLSKVHWRYIIIDEGHRIKNASCKLNADLKHYQSSHRLLLTGTPLQNNLEELWALLNFLLPNIFNSSEDFSQWFNKPFRGNGDNSTDEALLSEEENLLVINRLHQVLRPFVLRRLKHKVENQLPEKIERLIRCEASAYQKLLMKRVEENLGSLGNLKARAVQNSVMELRNICNHPYLSQLHAEEVDNLIPKHYLPPIVRLCGKLEMLDRLLPKLKATDHRVLFFSTMTRLLDVMEEYLVSKHYSYLRLDGQTSGGDRGALIDSFNQPNSPFFIFLLSIRAGGVGVNLQAADTVIIFDTDWNPQVDLQAQARAHRIGQKKDVLVLRFETVRTVEEQVRAAAEHKLGVANQSITAGFFDNDTSAEDRREYLESLLRESKKEEAAPVLDDDALNDILARSESEIDIFESVDKQRREEELARWAKLVSGPGPKSLLPLPSRLVTDYDLKAFYDAMKIHEEQRKVETPNASLKRKSGNMGSLNTEQYGRGKRAREVRSYEEQMTEEEFEKMCQVESPRSLLLNDGARIMPNFSIEAEGSEAEGTEVVTEPLAMIPPESSSFNLPLSPTNKDVTPPSRRGRGRPKRTIANIPSTVTGSHVLSGVSAESHRGASPSNQSSSGPENSQHGVEDPSAARFTSPPGQSISTISPQMTVGSPSAPQRRGRRQATLIGGVQRQRLGESGSSLNPAQPFSGGQVAASTPTLGRGRGRGRKSLTSAQTPNGRGRRSSHVPRAIADVPVGQDECPASTADKSWSVAVNVVGPSGQSQSTAESNTLSMPNTAFATDAVPPNVPASMSSSMERSNMSSSREQAHASGEGGRIMHPEDDKGPPGFVSTSPYPYPPAPAPAPATRQSRRSQGRVEAPQRRGRKSVSSTTSVPDVSLGDTPSQPSCEDASRNEQPAFSTMGPAHGQSKNADVRLVASMMKNMLSDSRLLKSKGTEHNQEEQASGISHTSLDNVGDGKNDQALISKLSPGGSEPSAAASGLENQASSHQNETLGGTEVEGRRLLVPATKAVVLGLEGKSTSGSLGMVARQYETENLDDMPAFPPGFEKFEASEGRAIEDGVGSVDAPKELPVTTEATDLVIEDQTPITKKDQIPSSRAQPVDICMNLQKNAEVLDEDRDLNEPTSIANKPAPGGVSETSEMATDLEINSDEGLPKDMTVYSSQMVTFGIEKVVNNSTQSTSGLEDLKKARNLDEDQREAPADTGSDSKDLDEQGEVGIRTTGVLSSDVSASEESSPLDKVKEASEPPSDYVTDKNIVACSELESSPNVSELWEREPAAKSEVSFLVIKESATSINETHGKNNEVAVENCLVSNSMFEEVSETRSGSVASPGAQSVPDETSNMAMDDEILPMPNAEAFSSESMQSHINSQESGDILVEGHDLSSGPESPLSEPVSLERTPALDDAPGCAEALTEVEQNIDERLLKDSSMVISESVSVDTEKRERDLHPRQPAPAIECIEDAVKMNEDIPCRSCVSDAAEVDDVDMSGHDKVIPEAASDLLKASANIVETQKELDKPFDTAEVDDVDMSGHDKVIPEAASDLLKGSAIIVETQKELDKPFAMPLMVDNDWSSLAKLEGGDSEIRDCQDHGQINEKEMEHDDPSERDCPPSSPLRNSEVYDVSEQLCIDPTAEVEDSDDRENSGHVDEFIPEHSYESKRPSSPAVIGDRLSDFPSEGHDTQMNDGQALCQVDEIVPEESYPRNERSSTPERDLSSAMKLADQAEETNVCSDPPQSTEVVPENSSAGNQLASFILTNGESSDAKAGVVDFEFGNLKEISQDSVVVPDNLLQESIKPASYAFSEKQSLESHEDSATIASAEEKIDAHQTTIEIEENAVAEVTSDLEIAEAHNTIIDDQGDVSLADSVVPEAVMESLNHSLLLDKVSPEILGGNAPLSDLLILEEEQMDSDENVQTMQVVDEGRDASEFYTPPSSPMIVDKPEISREEGEVNEASGNVKHSSEDRETPLHKDIKEYPSEVMGFMPEDHLKGDPTSTETENGLAFVSVKRGEGSEPETSRGHSLQGDGIDAKNIDSLLVKPELTKEILHLPFEVLKELQRKEGAVNEGMESHKTEDWVGWRSDTTCVDDVVMNSPSAGNESSVLLPLDVIREGQIVDDKVKGQTGADVAVTSDERVEETNRIDNEVMDSASAGNESSDILPSVTMKDGQSEDGSVNKLTEGHETAMQDEREPESTHFDDSVMDRASDENESSEILPLVAVNEGQSEDDAVVREEWEPEATRIDDAVMDGASPENEHSEMLPLGERKEGQSEDDTVKEQTGGGETVMGEERELDAGHIDEVVMKCASEGNESSEIWPSEVIKEGQSDADAVNEQANKHETITSGGSESDTNFIHDVAPDSASAESKSLELLPLDAIMEGQTEIDRVNEETEVPETVMGEGLESDAIRIDNVAVSTALARNESMEILPCNVIKDGQSECDPVNEQSEGPQPAMSEGRTSDTSRTDHVALEALEVLPSYIIEEVMDEGQIEDEPVNEHRGPEPLMSERREYDVDVGHIDDVAIVSALVENETSEVLPLEVNVKNEGKGEDHQVDIQTGGHKSLVSEGYESDATGDDDLVIADAVAVVPEEDVASKVQEEDMPSSINDLKQGAAGKVEPSSANDPKDDAADEDDSTSLKNDTTEVTVDDGLEEAALPLVVASEDSFGEKMETDEMDQGDGKATYSPAGQTSEGN